MNIFFLDKNPKKCAEYHCDKHCVKMIVEYAQILSTVHSLINIDNEFANRLLKPTHIHNRTVKWAIQSKSNYKWLSEVLAHLSLEYTSRYNRLHKYESDGLIQLLMNNIPNALSDAELSINAFESIVSDSSYVTNDPIVSYRNCYMNEKRYMINYKLNNWPMWFI